MGLIDKVLARFGYVTKAEMESTLRYLLGGRSRRVRKPGMVSFATLRRMSVQHVPSRIAINLCKRELSGLRWQVRVKKKFPETPGRRAAIEEVSNLLRRPEPGVTGYTFSRWVREMLEDMLALDAVAFELRPTRDGRSIGALTPLPGEQIEPQQDATGALAEDIPYVRVVNNKVVDRYRPGEIVYYMENPRTNSLYGLSPLETLILIVTSTLFADSAQADYWKLTELPEGILDLGADVTQLEVAAFREWWYGEMTGKPHKLAIIGGGKGARWIPFRAPNQDMQFRELQQWYFQLTAAVFGQKMSDMGLAEGMSGVAQSEQTYSAIRTSLRPRAQIIMEIINEKVIRDAMGYDDLEFEWWGYGLRDAVTQSQIDRTYGKSES